MKEGKEWRSMVSLGFRRKKSIVKMTGFTDIRRPILHFDPFYFIRIHKCELKKLGDECPVLVQHALRVETVTV